MAGDSIGERKAAHLEICATPDHYEVEGGSTMFDQVRFVHRSLPEIDTSEVDTATTFLGMPVALPFFISSMTGGSDAGYQANRTLARVAQRARIAVGMGSIRILYRKPEVIDHFLLKSIAPDVPVFANIGGVQLVDPDQTRLLELIRRLEVDAIAVHLNPGQECAQPEGDHAFRGVLEGIRRLCDRSPVPVIVKETGFGIAPVDARLLIDAGAAYVDVAGSGGTNWVTVERHRLEPGRSAVADEFRDWGLPTAALLDALRPHAGRVLASGGIRTGLDVAKSIALGAESAGLALPFIRAVVHGGEEAAYGLTQDLAGVLRTAMVLTGSRTVADLRAAALLRTAAFRDTVEQLTEGS